MPACLRLFLLFLFLLSLPVQLHAIGAEEALRPATSAEPVSSQVVRQGKSREGEVQDESQELLPALLGCIVCAKAEYGLALQAQNAVGIQVAELEPAEAATITALLQPFLSKPVTLRSLDDMAERVEAQLERTRGTMMRAAFPPQEITGGIVVLVIHPAVLGQVTLRGKPAFGAEFIAKAIHTEPGVNIDRDRISADLDWLNENPLRTARAVFSPSSKDGVLDLAIQVDAAKPWRVYSGFDNSLSDRLGDWRWYLGAQHGDLWHLDHRLTAQITAGFDAEALRGGSLTYEVPLPWRHLLEFGANYSESQSARNSGTTLVDQSGQFQRYSLAYIVPLPQWHGWEFKWRSGLSFRDQVYLLDATGPGGATDQRQLGWHGVQFETGLSTEEQDRLGTTRAQVKLLWSPGWEPLTASDADFRALGASDADSWIAEFSFSRTLQMKRVGMLSARLDAQWSDHALLAADQFGPAIFGRIRGFDEISGYGDNGASLSLEWMSPWLKAGKVGSIRGLTFCDGAVVHERSTRQDARLLSTGIGARWQWKMVSVQCDLGVPLSAPRGIETDPRARFSMTVRW
jgi:hemolysin activation/secretion protein